MPVFGLNNGTVSIFSYNYGAGKIDRVRKTLKLSLIVGFVVSAAVMVLYLLIPTTLLRFFDASPYMIEIGIPAVRICCISVPIGALSIIIGTFFQSLGRSNYALIINLCRLIIFMLPVAWLLSLSGILTNVWFSTIIGEAIALILAVALYKKDSKALYNKKEFLS